MRKLAFILLLLASRPAFGQVSTKARTFNGTSDILTSTTTISMAGATTGTYGFQYYDPSTQSADTVIFDHGYTIEGQGMQILSNWSGSLGTDLVYWLSAGGQYIVSFPRPSTDTFHFYEIQITPSGSNAGNLGGIFSVKIDGSSQSVTKVADSTPATSWGSAVVYVGGTGGGAFGAGRFSMISISKTSQTLTSCTDPASVSDYYWPIDQTSPEVAAVGAINLTVTGTTNSASPCAAPAAGTTHGLLLRGVPK